MATLRIRDLIKRYGDLAVVDHLNLEVNDGEFVTLLGPSGCGKTTTLRAVAGLLEIDGGQIFFDDQLMNDVPPHKRSASMVFQSYALFPHMTIRQNIEFGLKMQKVPGKEREERAINAMALVGLAGMENRRPANLSGGQQQRVALARAIVTQPKILLFDEPLSNLDLKLRERLRIEIRELQRRLKITSIYVTHDQAEALVISDRIVVMDRGKIEQIGDPTSIYNYPTSSFTAEFIGQANVMRAKIKHVNSAETILETPIGDIITTTKPTKEIQETMICWRPEDMTIRHEGMRNLIHGKVLRSIFMGNLTDVFVETNGITYRVQITGAIDWQPGDEIVLGIPEDRIRILN
jgi:iron(III) transport system ATP-binding protein